MKGELKISLLGFGGGKYGRDFGMRCADNCRVTSCSGNFDYARIRTTVSRYYGNYASGEGSLETALLLLLLMRPFGAL